MQVSIYLIYGGGERFLEGGEKEGEKKKRVWRKEKRERWCGLMNRRLERSNQHLTKGVLGLIGRWRGVRLGRGGKSARQRKREKKKEYFPLILSHLS